MRTRVGAYAVVVQGEHLLLARLTAREHRLWTLPGGGIDHGEHPEDAARREVLEETGLVVELDGLLGVGSHVTPAERRLDGERVDLHAIQVVYRAHVVGGDLQHEVDGSTELAAWLPLTQVADLARTDLVDRGLRMAGLLPD